MKKNKRQSSFPEMEKPSRTQKKKAAIAMQKTGEALLALNDEQLKAMALPDELFEALMQARNMSSHGARRRQLQYIGSLMRHLDAGHIEHQLAGLQDQSAREVRKFKQVEQWRDELKAGDDQRMDWLLGNFPAMDREELAGLVSAARESQGESGQRKAGRMLFRYLRRFAEE